MHRQVGRRVELDFLAAGKVVRAATVFGMTPCISAFRRRVSGRRRA